MILVRLAGDSRISAFFSAITLPLLKSINTKLFAAMLGAAGIKIGFSALTTVVKNSSEMRKIKCLKKYDIFID